MARILGRHAVQKAGGEAHSRPQPQVHDVDGIGRDLQRATGEGLERKPANDRQIGACDRRRLVPVRTNRWAVGNPSNVQIQSKPAVSAGTRTCGDGRHSDGRLTSSWLACALCVGAKVRLACRDPLRSAF